MSRIIIVGGGFAGINLANKLSKNHSCEVLLVDRNNYNFFPPLLYQVSTAFIEPSNVSYPFRKMFQGKKNVRFYMGSLQNVDPLKKQIQTENGSLSYDYLVLSLGTETNYFGMENIRKFGLPMKSVEEAINVRNYILLQLEKASRENDPALKKTLATIVISGGGPTGTEIAGMIAKLKQTVTRRDYPDAPQEMPHIYIVDALGSLLGTMSTKAKQYALKTLKAMGVNVLLNAPVQDYVNNDVIFKDGTKIPAATLIWTSGVIAVAVPGLPSASIGRGRRITVDEYNEVLGAPDIYAIGDQCLQTTDNNYPNGHPQLAQVAIQQGNHLAENFNRWAAGQPPKEFTYRNKGSMAIITKYKAVVDLPKSSFTGIFAWFLWVVIHLIPIVGFRNKGKLISNWFFSSITDDPTLRLIIRPTIGPPG